MSTLKDLVVVIQRCEVEPQFDAGASQDLLQRWDRRLSLAALDPGNLGLRHTRPRCQLAAGSNPVAGSVNMLVGDASRTCSMWAAPSMTSTNT